MTGRESRIALALAAGLATLPATSATAGDGGPLPPPATAPESRLTVTPSEFEEWMAGAPDSPDTIAGPEESAGAAGVASNPPPSPPSLATPPPPRPTTPPPPVLTTRPTPPPPTAPRPDTTNPPPAPVLTPPEAPRAASVPPDPLDTKPISVAPETPPRPNDMRIFYAPDATGLPDSAHGKLDRLARWLNANPEVRVEIVGYSSTTVDTESKARRRSLLRSLAVRTYLIENGVLSTRMDVRALGDRTDEDPKDRVEVRLPPL